ncbi:MAG: tRNA uridine-5-carboxymethylaminomethyl(34) synthesis GTPase MnmE [Nitrospiraceae bacterium]
MVPEGNDTICAVATPPGEGGVAIVRVSGPHAVPLVDRLVRLRSHSNLLSVDSHRLYRAEVCGSADSAELLRDHGMSPGRARPVTNLDLALVVVMRAPRSYTGEDVVEVQCHGGRFIVNRICEWLVMNGARLAEPGEFTRRAFLNGRLDLSQAEGVLEAIRARSDESLRLAQELLRGKLSCEINKIVEAITGLLAQVEAGIDFVEEDVVFVSDHELLAGLARAIMAVDRLLSSWEEGRILMHGAKVVIVGRPNVGKSSLLNALLQSDRAIVTSIPGTTRDVLEEQVLIEGIAVRLSDTAGVRRSEDPIEQEGIRRTGMALEDADLVLAVLDGSEEFSAEDEEVLHRTELHRRLIVVNKSDRPMRWSREFLSPLSHGQPVVTLSARTGENLGTLRCEIAHALVPRSLEAREGAVITKLRHRQALERAREALGSARESVAGRLAPEFLAADLRAALDPLGEITGRVSTEDVLDRIFAEFCIGK